MFALSLRLPTPTNMRKPTIIILCSLALWLCLLVACNSTTGAASGHIRQKDERATALLQGIWLNMETEALSMWIKGDSIYYPDSTDAPVAFMACDDTLFVYGSINTAYPIDTLTANLFGLRSSTGETILYAHSINKEDSTQFMDSKPEPIALNGTIKRDSVIFSNNERYHCYICINPSSRKVYRTSYNDEGLAVENVYYDNVIHICVYQGSTCLYAADYTKGNFAELVPEAFLNQAVLANMTFKGSNKKGCIFVATIAIPDDAGCYMVEILVDHKGTPALQLATR